MQPDGTLNPSAEPVEEPGPARQRRVLLARPHHLGARRGLRRLPARRPGVRAASSAAAGPRVAAIDRQVLDKDGQLPEDRRPPHPGWLIADGADASAEAVLGLAAYVRAGGTAAGPARAAPAQRRHRPAGRRRRAALAVRRRAAVGAVPLGLARLVLADAGRAGRGAGRPRRPLAGAGSRPATRSPSTRGCSPPAGPTTAGCPTRTDATQIAYGADSRVQSLIATAPRGGGPARRLVAAWFFGANAAGAPTYDPATGVTFDGVAADGTVNRNSGAESTIHGLLTMLALDAHPGAARDRPDRRRSASRVGARPRRGRGRDARRRRQRRDARRAVDRRVAVRRHRLRLAARRQHRDLRPRRPPARAADAGRRPAARQHRRSPRFTRRRRRIGVVRAGAIGPAGRLGRARARCCRAPCRRTLAAGSTPVTVTTTTTGDETRLDALMVQPLVTRLVLGGDGHGTALLRSAATRTQHARGRGARLAAAPTSWALRRPRSAARRTPPADGAPPCPSGSRPAASPWSAR